MTEQIELLTLTRLWLFPRHLYRFLDRPLASPINLRLIALAVPAFAAAFLLLSLTPLTLTSGLGLGMVPYLLVPGLFVWWALTRLAAGAKLLEVAGSQVRLVRARARRRTTLSSTRPRARAAGPWTKELL